MVINFNGCKVGSGAFGNSTNFDEKKSIRADGIDCVTVICYPVNVIVTANNTDIIEAHFHGDAIVDNKPTLNINKNGSEVVVVLEIGGNIIGNLTLTVNVPMRMFETLNVTSDDGNVSVKTCVSAKKIRLHSHNRDVKSEGYFTEISATTHNGNADVYIDAKNNVKIEASSHNGNVSVELQNISTSNITTSTCNGTVKDCIHSRNGGYTAYGQATSYNGNVVVK